MKKYFLLLVAATLGLATPAIAAYTLAGSFNSWNNQSHPLTQISSSVWMLTVSGLVPGQMHEFKITDGTWTWSYPEQNSWCQADAEGKFSVAFRSSTFSDGWWPKQNRIELSVDPGTWTIVGGFNDWNNSDPATQMTHLGLGIYELSLTLSPGIHLIRPVVTGTWYSFGREGRSVNPSNLSVEIAPGFETVNIFLNAFAGSIVVVGGKPQCGDSNHPYPEGDLNNDCRVNLADLAILVANWLKCTAPECVIPSPGEPEITWVYVDDPGVPGYEGFTGYMSKYETTNAQFAQYLNEALASGDIIVDGDYVVGNSGPYSGQNYYRLDGLGVFGSDMKRTNQGASRINYNGGTFTVESGLENHPVTYVSWYGATAFAEYYGWRLPTEWEWQAVADYDGTYIHATGESLYTDTRFLANYRANGYNDEFPNNLPYHPWIEYGTSEVGYFGTFGYGLADMTGNVKEWTSSVAGVDGDVRITCGSIWFHDAESCKVSLRGTWYPDNVTPTVGFRVCR